MNIFFADQTHCELADRNSAMLSRLRRNIAFNPSVTIVDDAAAADAVLIEERGSFKDFRYVNKLLRDPFIKRFAARIFSINSDDCATGLLRGLYTSLPKSRFDRRIHRAVPFMFYPNELVFSKIKEVVPHYLATWRGNTKSNALRRKMMGHLKWNSEFVMQKTESWLNHKMDEKQTYVDVMLSGKFSLCPAGWAPVTYRIYESIALGRCPVILADEFVPPEGPDWKQFALFYPQSQINSVIAFLHKHEHNYQQLGERAAKEWKFHFGENKIDGYFSKMLIDLIETAPSTSLQREQRRWQSLKLFWSNNWTLPQRVVNKANRWTRTLISQEG